jgi:hypothetical protein
MHDPCRRKGNGGHVPTLTGNLLDFLEAVAGEKSTDLRNERSGSRDRFSEGFETADLKTAKAYLDSLQ